MGYWKEKLVPKLKKVFTLEKNGKKAAAAEACKSFDGSKDEISKEVEEKKTELQPKVTEVYEASSTEIKTLVKDRTPAVVKKHSTAVTKFLEELVKIEFPGSKAVSEAANKFGPAYVSDSVLFVFEKVSTFVVTEEPAAEPAAATEEAAAPAAEESSSKETPAATEEKKEEIEKVAEQAPTPPPPAAAAAASTEEKKEEPGPTPAEESAAAETPAPEKKEEVSKAA